MNLDKLIPLETKTQYGTVIGTTNQGGERYYFLKYKGAISLMPATLIEEE